MLRFILEHVETRDELGGTRRELFTFDFEMPVIERQLALGGRGEMGSEYVRLVGVEVLPEFELPELPELPQ